MESKKRGRPAKKKTEADELVWVNEWIPVTPEPEPITLDKAYFKNKLESLAEEIQLAIKLDRSLSIRLKSVYTSINQAAKKL